VLFQDNSDLQIVVLSDGRQLQVDYNSLVTEEVINQWHRDRSLLLAYSLQAGVVLHDPQTKHNINIVAGLNPHPIDKLMSNCMQKNNSQTHQVDCLLEANGRWDTELNRAYKSLMRSLQAQPKQSLKQAQRLWMAFRDSQAHSISDIIHKTHTMWKVLQTERVMQLTKLQALRLMDYQAWQ